jgi:hypothetical protein
LGLKNVSENILSIDFLGRTYEITKEGIQMVNQQVKWISDKKRSI